MPEPSEEQSGWKRKLALALCVGLATVTLCEAAARILLRQSFHDGERQGTSWYLFARFDSKLGWANEPNASGKVVTQDFSYHATINSIGLRDPETAAKKRPGVPRVLFLGDSMTWGWGVSDGERFTDLLAQQLAPRVEVINAAVPGYGTDQALWNLESRGDALAPDLVVLVFVLNDIRECNKSTVYGMNKPRFVFDQDKWSIEGLPVVDPRSAMKRWFSRALLSSIRSHSALWTGMERLRRNAGPADGVPRIQPYDPESAPGTQATAESLYESDSPARHALSLIRAWCEQRSTPFAVVVLPHGHDQYLYEPATARPEFDGTTSLTKALVRVGSELQFPVFNIDALMFDATGRGQRLHGGDSHLNQAGNRLAADALKPRIEAWLASTH